METMIVELTVGATDVTCEFMLPAHVSLAALTQNIVQLLEQVYQYVAVDRENTVVYDLEQHCALLPEWTLAQSGVRDGSSLIIL